MGLKHFYVVCVLTSLKMAGSKTLVYCGHAELVDCIFRGLGMEMVWLGGRDFGNKFIWWQSGWLLNGCGWNDKK